MHLTNELRLKISVVYLTYRNHHPRCPEEPSTERIDLIRSRLQDGYSVDDLCAAIEGMHICPHNLGRNDRNTRYLGLHIAMRPDNVERFAELWDRHEADRKREQRLKQGDPEENRIWAERKRKRETQS